MSQKLCDLSLQFLILFEKFMRNMATFALVRRESKDVGHKAGWKIDKNEEACYIDIEADEEDGAKTDDPHSYSEWCNLPSLVLEQIFSYLNIRERYYASLVCSQWYYAFYLPKVWTNFVVDDHTLTRAKYNYYSGWQHCLDHMRLQQCLGRVGRCLRGLEFRPQHSFNNVFQFMTMLSWSMDKSLEKNPPRELIGVGERIRCLVYRFPCNMSLANDPEGIKLFGTGGQLLKGLKELLTRLRNLRVLKLIDFVLESYEAKHLLDDVLKNSSTTMREMNLVNVTTTHCPILHVGFFVNLQILTISPQNIDDSVVYLLANTKLKHLHLLQNCYTTSHLMALPCSVKAWRTLKRYNPDLKVHLRAESIKANEVVFQPEAPVFSVLYSAPKSRISSEVLLRMVDHYKNTLTVYGHELLPRFVSPKPFHSRIDSMLLLICRQCFNLHTLIVREKISTSTVLLIAHTAKNLQHLHIRRFAVIIRCDWPRHPEWSYEFFVWLRRCSRSYEDVEREVSSILGYEWHFLSDQDFKNLRIEPQLI